jgi:SAM-dependent methyltransferase
LKHNGVERALMNNPVRAFIQRRYELPLLERLGAPPPLALRPRPAEAVGGGRHGDRRRGGSFDAVVDFGILHHVPNWQAAVAEIGRVLRPGGRFYFEEVSRQALDRRAYRALFAHPWENRFSRGEFVGELEQRGIVAAGNVVERLFGDFFFGVGRLREALPAAGGRVA